MICPAGGPGEGVAREPKRKKGRALYATPRGRPSADRSLSSRRRHTAHGCFGLLRPMRQAPVRPNEVTGVAIRIFLQVVLMLGLGLPERSGGGNLGDDPAPPQARSINVGDGVPCDPVLLPAHVQSC